MKRKMVLRGKAGDSSTSSWESLRSPERARSSRDVGSLISDRKTHQLSGESGFDLRSVFAWSGRTSSTNSGPIFSQEDTQDLRDNFDIALKPRCNNNSCNPNVHL